MTHKAVSIMLWWRHTRTRDIRVALAIFAPSGILMCEDGISAVLEGDASVVLTFHKPIVLLKPLVLVDYFLAFCSDID